ncbi:MULTISPECIES: transcription initiation factor TFIIIB [Paenibacillus]|uniref:Transcription initiation factor TFIIIB n=1 Tax=Paenibacillus pabuli TaxID=1472 RepID=A0A855Y749_9BACL|nr:MULTISPECIES: transcription initiation factor TFIIIB [Paenibacillus]PWW38898.1 hypothetical protein DET56_107300 [Paenibacillus pabuli]PXW06083.1 hypothetical protein DEU73_107300 [Paenibacillus taichungensis]QLG40390.1 transcription initiation factor TFIIIB [Paenibacillus sp. E222]RAI89786.1 hypothetical protein DET54_11369 [Paenibacillus pabuli]SEK61656.1 hypothetical protein SAMN05518856_103219 [Paenibacillus sp. OK003]
MRNEECCPECGGTKFGEGKSHGEARVYPMKKMLTLGSDVTHVICITCGFILKSFVKEPHKFEDNK